MKSIDLAGLSFKPGRNVRLADFDPAATCGLDMKDDGRTKLRDDIERLAALQEVLYAQGHHALLVIFQGMDAAGKDGAIKHVMSGVNPQGVDVTSFKTPSVEELAHDYLWRCARVLPERGRIGIFNRSYYEEVIVVRVHAALLESERLPVRGNAATLWKERFEDIVAFERHLARNGTLVLKFFLHISKDEQRRRLLKRIDTPEKHWKLSPSDVRERSFWDSYQNAYEEMLSHTSSEAAPWYVVPANRKRVARAAVASVIVDRLQGLDLAYPPVSEQHRAQILAERERLTEPDEPAHGRAPQSKLS